MASRHVIYASALFILLLLLIHHNPAYNAQNPFNISLTGDITHRGDSPFISCTNDLPSKSRILAEKARSFDEKLTLERLGTNPLNTFYYRFDENLGYASYASHPDNNTIKESFLYSIEFTETDDASLSEIQGLRGLYAVEDGLFKVNYTRKTVFESIGPLNIPTDAVGEIVFRAKNKRGKTITLGWSNDSHTTFKNAGLRDVDVIADNRFHTYRLNPLNILKHKRNYGTNISKLFLKPSDVPGDEASIDYIRFISKTHKYAEKPVGLTYDTINEELRQVIYLKTPTSLEYRLTDIPGKDLVLDFGLGVLNEDDPVSFHILVQAGGRETEVFSQTITDNKRWHDYRIDLSAVNGEDVALVFKADSAEGNIAFWSNPILYTPPSERLNIIIVLEDALRADHMSAYGHIRKTTPAKDEFIKDGVLFHHSISQATSTRPSCPTIMTSLYPTATGVLDFSSSLHDNYLTLAEVLRSQGFATASFIQNSNAGANAGLHQGFSHMFDKNEKKTDVVYSRALEWASIHTDRNLFMYLHIIDPHGPYKPPREFAPWFDDSGWGGNITKNLEFDAPWVETPTEDGRRALYDGEIRYNDYQFGLFKEGLDGLGLLDDTLFILISDHGEHLGEHSGVNDLWGHKPPSYIQAIHVPLIMVYPKKLPKNRSISQLVQNIDVMPTILEMAEIDRGNMLLQGESLMPLMDGVDRDYWDGRMVLAEEALAKRGRHDINEWSSLLHKDRHMLYSPTVGSMTFDFINDCEEVEGVQMSSELLEDYKAYIRAIQGNNTLIWEALTNNTDVDVEYDPDVIRELRALGYMT